MKISGFLKFSALDYPGKLSAVIFCQGCSLRCHYCHNPDFQDTSIPGEFEFDEILEFLGSREGLLDAVVFSGGEPLLQADLKESIKKVKALGFSIGIHTSGVVPKVFEDVLSEVDWVGFDLKTTFKSYEKVTGVAGSGELAKISFEKLIKSKVTYEIRTTFDSRFISEKNLYDIAEFLKESHVKEWILQECILRDGNVIIERLHLPDDNVLSDISNIVDIEVRRG